MVTPDRRNIAGIIERPRKIHDPLVHLLLVEVEDAQAFGTAPQLAGVLGGDDNAVGHHSDQDGHTWRKARL